MTGAAEQRGLCFLTERLRSEQGRVRLGRLLLFFTGLLLASMPFTERFLTWDAFVLGGHDLELTSIGVALFFGLVALSADRLAATSFFGFLLRLCGLCLRPPAQRGTGAHASPYFRDLGSGAARTQGTGYALPLRI